MHLFEFLHKYFGFNKRERNGLVLLLAVILILVLVRIFLPSGAVAETIEVTKLEAIEQAKEFTAADSAPKTNYKTTAAVPASSLFPFDPNTVSAEDAKKLGFPDKLFSTLNKYRSKGGKFRSKEDLQKLYGMKGELYQQLEPFILIAPPAAPAFASKEKQPFVKAAPAIIDLNTADSLQLLSLPMIGPGFTKRILKFRNALGGFYKADQLKEVYGMTDSTYLVVKERIRVSAENIRKIRINTAGIDELKKHPYINYTIASTIINYRSKHGLFKTANDLAETGSINDALLDKLKAYLSFE